ncbi:hypothetical protein HY090_01675, partial [Candidatus Kaiserbacteria bacterium]|nr:hypothetical protein [Candidatus Kaiserbacteria bacterium]
MTMMGHSRDFRKRVLHTGLGVLVLGVVIFFGSPLALHVRGALVNLLAPHNSDAQYTSLSRDALIARLKDSESALSRIGYQAVLYGLLADENAKLRHILNVAAVPQGILARVLSRPPTSMYDTLVVDQGTAAGVSANDLVEFEDVALGRISSRGVGNSTVRLFSSSGSDEDVTLGKPQAIAVAHGLGGGAFELSVPQGISVSVGDAVRVSGTESLLLGLVGGVFAKPTDSSQTIYVRLPLSLSELDFIEIIPAQK